MFHYKHISLQFAAALCVVLSSTIFLPTTSLAESPYLLGNWGGERQVYEKSGFTYEAVNSIDLMANVDGGIDEGFEAPMNLDLIAVIDTGAAGWWSGGTINLYLLSNGGGDLSARVGDFQTTSNIEAVNTFKIYEAWYEHRFMEDTFSILAGLHDYNSEFDVLEYAGLFLNSSFGIQPDISQVGPSIFSTTSLAVRLAWQPTDNSYLMAAVYDGVPGDPADPRGTHVNFDKGDGIFAGFEGALLGGDDPADPDYFKLAIGGWYHTMEFEDFNTTIRDDNGGIYVIGEKHLFSEGDSSQGMGGFVQLGFTESDRNVVDRYIGVGINYTGLIPGRDEDVIGLAIAHAMTSDDYISANPGTEGSETAIELSYQFMLLPWLSLQPDVQYIINPGMDSTLDNALVLGVRLQIAL